MARDQAYRPAEEKIEAARRKGAKELDLSGMELTELPESLGNLTQLQLLDLHDNELVVIPEWLGVLIDLPKLQLLDLSSNGLRALPEWVGRLGELRVLKVSDNQLETLPESIGQLTQLQTLDLSGNLLSSISGLDSLGLLTQLQELDLSNSGITTLPQLLGQLTWLQSLNLSYNQLEILQDSLGLLLALTQLKKLNLSNNQLTTLPKSLGQLTQLNELDLHNNGLKTLPRSLRDLKKLQGLNLSMNEIVPLPESLWYLTQLKWLDLSKNELTELPNSLGLLTQLHSLHLSGNRLAALPESLGRLTQLQSLHLSNNQLTVLPKSLGQLTQLQLLDLSDNQLTMLPKSLGQLTQLQSLVLSDNQLTALPEVLSNLTKLQLLNLSHNQLKALPEALGNLEQLQVLNLSYNQLTTLPETLELTQMQSFALSSNQLNALPESLGNLIQLQSLDLSNNQLTALPESLGTLTQLQELMLQNNLLIDLHHSLIRLKDFDDVVYYKSGFESNPLNPELAAAYKEGLDAVKAYLRAKAAAQIILNEAKLILVGEGEVGKSCLLGALRGDPWEEGRPTTHGIEIKPIEVTDPDSKKEITLNGWDFGGQRVYRPTHQLFFSAPAVYLVVWKPREGPQQGFVKEWIQLVKRREPSAKIIVVATHGGPQQRQPDIDRQELWDLFGKETVVDFFFVDSKPDERGHRKGIAELKLAIARVAASLPEVGRSVPKSFADVRQALQAKGVPFLPLDEVLTLCRAHKMDDGIARLFIIISHRLGHLTHYENDPALRDIVILRPDWLATAMSYVLDDEVTRKDNHGLVSFDRLRQLWHDPKREPESRYAPELHPLFLRLMERFDLSYKVALPDEATDAIGFWQQFKGTLNQVFSGEKKLDGLRYTSLIGQLVPDVRPVYDLAKVWSENLASGDLQQTQICRIVDKQTGQSATAEGLFYQMIVRLHKYSFGRANYNDSVHWQRGLVLDNAYNGRAFLEHKGNDVHITVRAAFPERFLAVLTSEVKWLVEDSPQGWHGLRCDVMVPCIEPCGKHAPGTGLFEVEKLIAFKRQGMILFPCMVSGCSQSQNIDTLLRNAPIVRPVNAEELFTNRAVLEELRKLRSIVVAQQADALGRFDKLDAGQREILSKADASYTNLLQVFTDEAKEGPRLFSLVPIDRSKFNPREWTSAKFRLTLWCEHSRLPLPSLDGKDSKKGVYEVELTRSWFKKAAPFLKVLTGTLSLALPVVASGVKLAMDDAAYEAIDQQLDFGKDVIDASLEGSEKISDWLGGSESTALEHGEAIRAQGATLRELHALLKAKVPGFGGLIRVMNKRQEFLWVHPQFEKEY